MFGKWNDILININSTSKDKGFYKVWVNNELKYEADSLSSKLVEYDGRIKRLNTRIYVIKKETEEKLNAIDTLGSSQLQEFFTARYPSSNSN